MKKLNKKSFQDLLQENKKELLNDKQAIKKIEIQLEQRHEFKKLAEFS
ncbi:FbpB family small basic protein [Peribacillus loiseleuriae]